MRRTPVSFSIPVLPVSTKERTATAAKIHCYVENRVKLRVMDGHRTVENENRWGLRAEKQVYFPWNGKINTLIWQILWVTLNSFRSAASLSDANQLWRGKGEFEKKQLDFKQCRWKPPRRRFHKFVTGVKGSASADLFWKPLGHVAPSVKDCELALSEPAAATWLQLLNLN